MRALLIGNYGVGNFGDEALKNYFVSAFPDIEWTVVTNEWRMKNEELRLNAHSQFFIRNSSFVPRLPYGLRSLFTPWWKTIRALCTCDVVVFGGGTLFTDIESPKACGLWGWHASWARRCGKPYVLAFQGIGPFRTYLGGKRAEKAVKNAAFVSVRDHASRARVDAWRKDTVLTFDPAVLYFADHMGAARHGGKTLIVIPRENPTDAFFLKLKLRMADARFTGARILSFKPDDAHERSVCARIREESGKDVPVTEVRTVADLERGLQDASLIFTQRFHGAIAAMALGIPFETVAQNAGDKLSAMSAGPDRAACVQSAGEGERALKEFLAGKR